MADFVGRDREFRLLERQLRTVEKAGAEQPGRCLIMRGRRRVGKSRLVEEFRRRTDAPSVFFTASRAGGDVDLAVFIEAVTGSDLPGRDLFTDAPPRDWDTALRLLARTLPDERPSLVIIDELPFLTATVTGFESLLQRAWDRYLSRKPVLLMLIGSDLSIMESLNDYDRPFHQRGKPMVVEPLSPHEVRTMLKLTEADAFDAFLVTGGMPLQCAEWEPGANLAHYLRDNLSDPTSALAASAELSLAAEYPADTNARTLLTAIGTGERTFTSILSASRLTKSTMERSLSTLLSKGAVVGEVPLSAKPSRETRYRIADPYLRFWLRFVGPHFDEIDRGRPDRLLARIDAGWSSWRGRAVEPLVREALWRLLPDERTPWLSAQETARISGYWTRGNTVEIDVVAADRAPVAKRIGFVGSVKWHDRDGLDRHDLTELVLARDRLPGATDRTPLIAVSRVAGSAPGFDLHLTARDLMRAWA